MPHSKPPLPGELLRAAATGDLARVKALLDHGADIEEKDSMGDTPLNEAARTNHCEVALLLIERGAQINVLNRHGKNALGWARHSGHAEIIKILSHATDQEQCKESWEIVGPQKLARIGIYPKIQKKLTDIFDLATRERIVITDDLRSKSSASTPITSFDKLAPDQIETILDEFKKLGGHPDEDYVRHGVRPIKKLGGPTGPKH